VGYKKGNERRFSSTANAEALDECPMAYKSMDDILTRIEPTARVMKRIQPLFNFKAGENQGKKGKRK